MLYLTRKVGESVQQMGLKYATVTGVARDDLDDARRGLRFPDPSKPQDIAHPHGRIDLLGLRRTEITFKKIDRNAIGCRLGRCAGCG